MRLLLTFVFLVLLSLSHSTPSADAYVPKSLENELIGYLPTDVETLIVSKKPYQLKYFGVGKTWVEMQELMEKAKRQKHEDDYRTLPINVALGFADDELGRGLSGKTVLFGIEGSKRFRAPHGNAGSRYDGCHLCWFKESIREEVDQAINRFPKRIVHISEEAVNVMSVKWGFESVDIFIATPKKNLLVVTTDQTDMETVLNRMKTKQSNRALPASFPEWSSISSDSSFYAIRHFNKFSEDDMSPYCSSLWEDPSAVGFAICASTYRPMKQVLCYYSKNPSGHKAFAGLFKEVYVSDKKISEHCSQIQIPIRTPEEAMHFDFIFGALLGHMPYL